MYVWLACVTLYATMHTACNTYRSFCHWQEQWRHEGKDGGQHHEQFDGHCKEGEEGLTIKLKTVLLIAGAYFL